MTTRASAIPTRSGSRVLGAVVIVVALGAVVFGIAREMGRSVPATTVASVTPAAAPSTAAIPTVYYFHGDRRCATCVSIEEQTAALMRAAFAQDIAAGRLQFRVVNFDAAADRHFRDDYQLSFGSVVVASADNTKWENLGEVWPLEDDREAFERYLIEHIQPYVKAGP